MKLLNLGCGNRFHPDWINLDLVARQPNIIAHDILAGIPFPNEYFDLVYHSHVLEHLPKDKAKSFIQECHRVLQPKGILRVVVPDLEIIAQLYLKSLQESLKGSTVWQRRYDWILLEMYDQVVRETVGGEMKVFLSDPSIDVEFVLSRLGPFGKKWMEEPKQSPDIEPKRGFSEQCLKPIYRFFRYPTYRKETLLKMILGSDYELLRLGKFRRIGEIHQWMYDRYSLERLLRDCGFSSVTQYSASESQMPNWSNWHLDTEVDGTVSKPDSLYIEAIK